MQQPLCYSQILRALTLQCNNGKLIQAIISFLDKDDLLHFYSTSKSFEPDFFHELIKINFFLRQYVNRVDRSLFYSFFQHEQFQRLQHELITKTFEKNLSEQFNKFTKQYQQCFSLVQQLLPITIQKKQLIDELDRMIFDPDLPLPHLKRENEGIFCNTPFQNFLVNQKFDHNEAFQYFGVFEELKNYFEEREEFYLRNILISMKKTSNISQKLCRLRFTPYEIAFQNIDEFLIQKNSFHNLIVSLYAISDIWLNSTKIYIQTLTDSFHRYVQFLTRYSIYRNWVLMVEENFGFLFKMYHEVYEDIFNSKTTKYHFWRGAMTKWLLKMQQFHHECNKVYFYSFTKQRTKIMLDRLNCSLDENPHISMFLKNRLEMREYEISIKNELQRNEYVNEVEDFFLKNKEEYEITLIEYTEYMVDLSINEQSVHWCGYSKHILSKPYTIFQDFFLNENNKFIKTLISEKTSGISPLLHQIYFIEADFMKRVQVKPVTLYKLIDQYNTHIRSNQDILFRWENCEQEEDSIIMEDFEENNNLLQFCNNKNNIRFDLDEKQLLFYSIHPIVPAKQLTKSISTAIDSMYEDENSEGDKMQLQGMVQLIQHKSEVIDEEEEKPNPYLIKSQMME